MSEKIGWRDDGVQRALSEIDLEAAMGGGEWLGQHEYSRTSAVPRPHISTEWLASTWRDFSDWYNGTGTPEPGVPTPPIGRLITNPATGWNDEARQVAHNLFPGNKADALVRTAEGQELWVPSEELGLTGPLSLATADQKRQLYEKVVSERSGQSLTPSASAADSTNRTADGTTDLPPKLAPETIVQSDDGPMRDRAPYASYNYEPKEYQRLYDQVQTATDERNVIAAGVGSDPDIEFGGATHDPLIHADERVRQSEEALNAFNAEAEQNVVSGGLDGSAGDRLSDGSSYLDTQLDAISQRIDEVDPDQE